MNDFKYDEAKKYIENTAVRGSILGLSRIKRLLDILKNPQNSVKCIHVAGTNGKGSTACFISSILTKASYKTGFYYSPSMTGIKDHYMVNGIPISDEDYTWCVNRVCKANADLLEAIGEEATQFELETAMAFLYFQKMKCDIMIIETGLGGRDDATNVCEDKIMCVITSISRDHTAILGDELTQIADIKSGIITNSCPVVAYDSNEDTSRVIAKKCSDMKCKLTLVRGKLDENVELSLEGEYQRENALIAYTAIKELRDLNYNISDDDICKGLKEAYWPFRMEKICDFPLIYVDGAHNPDAAAKLRNTIEGDKFIGRTMTLVLGMFKDKEYEKVISTMVPLADRIYSITVPNMERALLADDIKRVALKYIKDPAINVEACKSIEECAKIILNSETDYVLACGSLSYLNDFKAAIMNEIGE